jgi:hypothetical protein
LAISIVKAEDTADIWGIVASEARPICDLIERFIALSCLVSVAFRRETAQDCKSLEDQKTTNAPWGEKKDSNETHSLS